MSLGYFADQDSIVKEQNGVIYGNGGQVSEVKQESKRLERVSKESADMPNWIKRIVPALMFAVFFALTLGGCFSVPGSYDDTLAAVPVQSYGGFLSFLPLIIIVVLIIIIYYSATRRKSRKIMQLEERVRFLEEQSRRGYGANEPERLCPGCGNIIEADSKLNFCIFCGAKLT